jgi:hypothetical protein
MKTYLVFALVLFSVSIVAFGLSLTDVPNEAAGEKIKAVINANNDLLETESTAQTAANSVLATNIAMTNLVVATNAPSTNPGFIGNCPTANTNAIWLKIRLPNGTTNFIPSFAQ